MTPSTQSPTRHAPTPRPPAQAAMQRCPSCRLAIRQRHPKMPLDYCPRCIAREHKLVSLEQGEI